MRSIEKKIRSLLFSSSKETQDLGWLLDKSQNHGRVKQALEVEHADLLRQTASRAIEELLLATHIVCNQKNTTQIHVKNLPNVRSLSCQKHHQLRNFHISNCPNLTYLYCCNNDHLNQLNVEQCPSLIYLSCVNNQLNQLQIEAPLLTHLYATSNHLSHFDLSPYHKLFGLDFTKNPLQTLKMTPLQKTTLRPSLETFTQIIAV
ncbi:hypothetical protein [Aureispira sp. CCB-QB1]|uniref:hypothetical protein n=1 Tax=Aureispira sp. CCB-QB1 TaxID=1313421 RepID=UPI000696B8C8|nr:hypothetical protein [Aureispira sp. CCB-QB1]